jgi:hypothetical protein
MTDRKPITLATTEQDGIVYELQCAHVQPEDLAQTNTLQLPVAVVARKAEQ